MNEQNPPGFFIDWNGKIRSTTDPGGGYLAEVDTVAKYVGIKTPKGILMHEATFYKDLAAIAKAGIKGEVVAGDHPWGRPDEGL